MYCTYYLNVFKNRFITNLQPARFLVCIMANYVLKTFCCCGTLRTGTIISGLAAILLSIIGIIVIYVAPVDLKTIIFDWLPQWAIKVIITINLCMTVILSILLIIGVVKRNWYLMIPWVVLGGMLAIGLLISILINSINLYIDGHTLQGTLWLVVGLISLVIYCYMWYVSFSFFANLREESEKGAYTRDPFRRRKI
ncbi:uncharacterized protein LOC130443571 isoform X1 [Diorhabda sublineata]|uniref:uncharacterized protein LOC130443571 isoform X1 n=2 Tax=Diorhabda TaxID=217246 RepID=UPI0024E15B67|nr:uncharacterized protein LOC130443571 isoform X1 [Diorhabda sublineata]